jgi:hypothetical protein
MNKRSLMTVGIGAGLLAAVGTGVALVATSADGSASSAFTTSVSAPPTTAPAPTHAVRGHPGSQTTAVSSHVAQPLPAHVSVPKLRAMTPPDVVVRLNHAATPAGVRRLERSTGVGQVAVLDRGRITLTAGHRRIPLTVVGVPLGTIRGFVPSRRSCGGR